MSAFSLSLHHALICQNSNGIAIPFAFEFPMSTQKSVNQSEGRNYTLGVFVLGGDVTHRQPCRMLYIIGPIILYSSLLIIESVLRLPQDLLLFAL